ncbi:MAG: lysylphosphatidylglycerol synthase transmembrane domain-containing protein [Candidatus Parcubacteria bacterium]|nr:lysylphosphatidylglycerol synthase transmembrane domain-containing protein [Candidatus Parcubacteria bacterium]
MRRWIWFLIFFILGAILFYFTLREVGIAGVIAILSTLKGWQVPLLLLVLLSGPVIIGSYKWRMIIGNDKGKKVRLSKLMIARIIGYSISYVTPCSFMGGEPAKVLFLKQETNIPVSRIISSVILDELMFFSITTMVFFVGVFFLLIYLHLSWLAEIIGISILAAAIIALFLIIRKAKKVSSEKGLFKTLAEKLYLTKISIVKDNMGALDEVEEEMKLFFHRPKKQLAMIFLVVILELSAVLFTSWLTLYFLGTRLDITRLFVVRSMTDLSGFIPLPASLGTLEATQALAFSGITGNPATGVAFSLVFRGLNLVISAFGLAIFAWIQLRYLCVKVVYCFQKLKRKIKK